ncbi:hypothetical protein ACJ41O_011080 [Fusarium nematophilum]
MPEIIFNNEIFTDWKPLPDPRRPAFPYQTGLDLSIHRHVPPAPFGPYYGKGPERQKAPRHTQLDVIPSDWCLRNPPASTPAHPDQSSHSLRILDAISCKDGRGAQVAKCRLGQDEARVYVAKIYDPLYYSYVNRDLGTPVDVAWMADRDYSREAAAYEQLLKSQVDGLYAPKYYGSWTFETALLGEPRTTRSVRMVRGVTMWSLMERRNRVHRIPPQQRLDILAEAMEVEAKVNFHGVKHADFAPRNLILVGSELERELPRVVLVDFNKSIVYDQPNCRYQRSSTHLPINPQYRHWGSCDPEFVSWVPEPHRSRPPAFKGWLKKQWDSSKDFAGRDEGRIRDLDYDEPVEMVSPSEDQDQENESDGLP